MLFEIDELMDFMSFCETLDQVVFVFPDALDQIAGDASVERSVFLACENVNGWLFHGWALLLDSRLRGNDKNSKRRILSVLAYCSVIPAKAGIQKLITNMTRRLPSRHGNNVWRGTFFRHSRESGNPEAYY